jgi:exodeoxyribonuclease VII small subunit
MGKEESFEDLMKRLEEITNKLEKEQLTLDDSVKLFEEGIVLSQKCNTKLEEAEKKITILIGEDDNLREENFIPEE